VLDRFERGLLFSYFGNTDQVSHMMWRPLDRGHPAYDPSRDPTFERVVEERYVQFDAIVGETLAKLGPSDLLVVMSDHGFTSWRRSFRLNTWLEQEGYLVLDEAAAPEGSSLFEHVDWSRTRAYGLGLNSLYLTMSGRQT
jgi:predicted AlkP superfamily phosphohydrolase/phosphomutase